MLNPLQKRALFVYYDMEADWKSKVIDHLVNHFRTRSRRTSLNRLFTELNFTTRFVTDVRLQHMLEQSRMLTYKDNVSSNLGKNIGVQHLPASNSVSRGGHFEFGNHGLFSEIDLMATAWSLSHLLGFELEIVINPKSKYCTEPESVAHIARFIDMRAFKTVSAPTTVIDCRWLGYKKYNDLADSSAEYRALYAKRIEFCERYLVPKFPIIDISQYDDGGFDAYFIRAGDKVGLESHFVDDDVYVNDLIHFYSNLPVVVVGDDNSICDRVVSLANKKLGGSVFNSLFCHYNKSGYVNANYNSDNRDFSKGIDNIIFNFNVLLKSNRFSGDIICNLVRVAALCNSGHQVTPLYSLPAR